MGPHTLAALKAFQSAHGLTPDGVIGARTRQALGL
jgi:peptidoglycan hydrolase-like protein with peptidoglycan-binding domain